MSFEATARSLLRIRVLQYRKGDLEYETKTLRQLCSSCVHSLVPRLLCMGRMLENKATVCIVYRHKIGNLHVLSV